jgi:hypothetical protein
MTPRFLLPLALCAAVLFAPVPAFAQSLNDAASSTRIQEKVRRVELLNLLLPVLLTKEQITALLPSVLKARKADEDLKKREAAVLRTLEADLDRMIKAGLDSKQVPPLEVVGKVSTAFQAMAITRRSLVDEQVGLVLAEVEKNLDSGQRKAAGGLVPKSAANPTNPEAATDEERLKIWVRSVLLDPLATDMLQRMAR